MNAHYASMLADLGQSELSHGPDGSRFAGIMLDSDPTIPGLVLEMPEFKHAALPGPCRCDLGLSANNQEGTLGSATSTRGLPVESKAQKEVHGTLCDPDTP